ncbi:MAG TPA: serine/threonine-protein kinase [Solirubrobacterales bacterium]|nr:serine/threonine-protein kinase [Solirubrobacterales bacterium]
MAEPSIGSTLGGYRIDGLIARGGMGVVYRATHLALERPVALKVIARHLAEQEGFRERFLSESRLAARLDHPGVVPVYDAREEDGELIVAMRFVKGGDLKKRIAVGGPLPVPEALDLLAQVAEALDAAHAAGVVHRDVKPHNILLEGDRAFLTDFGLAKALGDSGVLSDASVVGTAEYMSPEQWRGSRVGPAADVYSLGCVLYEATTGIAPFARQAGDSEPQMPRGLDAVIERAVAKDPAERYPSAGEMIEAARERQGATPTETAVLSEAADRPTLRLGERRARRRLPAWGFGLAGVVLVAAIATALLLFGDDDVSVSQPIEVGRGALRLAVGEGAVWATSAGDGRLWRIDPRSGDVAGEPTRLEDGIAGVAVGEGSIWVSSPRTGEVIRVEPVSRRRERIRVGGRPGAIVFGGGRIWVADEAGRGIVAINPGGEIHKRGIEPHAAPLRLTVGAGAVWVSSASTGSVRRIDFETASADEPVPAGRGPAGLTVGRGLVWVATTRTDTVSRVDPSIRSRFGEPIDVGDRPGGIDAGTSVVWVANAGDGTVSRIDMASGETIGDPIEVGPSPGAVVVGEAAVWVANNGDGTVTRIEP